MTAIRRLAAILAVDVAKVCFEARHHRSGKLGIDLKPPDLADPRTGRERRLRGKTGQSQA